MAFFRIGQSQEDAPAAVGEGLLLRAPRPTDFERWAELRRVSRAFLTPWEPLWPADDLTRAAFRTRLRRYAEEMRSDQAYPLLIFREEDHVLVGGLTLGQIRRGVSQTCSLGYWIGLPFTRQGYMTRAVRVATRHAFGALSLRRVEAACLPENIASSRVLEKVGFRFEGIAREYLCIAGAWRDHRLYALLAHDRQGPATPT